LDVVAIDVVVAKRYFSETGDVQREQKRSEHGVPEGPRSREPTMRNYFHGSVKDRLIAPVNRNKPISEPEKPRDPKIPISFKWMTLSNAFEKSKKTMMVTFDYQPCREF